ncbi:MAG: hypothetical protein ACT4NL_06115 [Pseudomarimonas sp.]
MFRRTFAQRTPTPEIADRLELIMVAPLNPYAAPTSSLRDELPSNSSAAESRRRELIRHEMLLKSVGSLYYFYGVFMLLALSVAGKMLILERGLDATSVVISIVLTVLMVANFCVGYGFRRLRPWAGIPGAFLAIPTLLSIPVGTLIGAYVLYLIFCGKGRQVLAADYQAVIAATPHIKYQRTPGDWIALGILVLVIVGIGVLLVVGSQSH